MMNASMLDLDMFACETIGKKWEEGLWREG